METVAIKEPFPLRELKLGDICSQTLWGGGGGVNLAFLSNSMKALNLRFHIQF
jgi:hypothetical protein